MPKCHSYSNVNRAEIMELRKDIEAHGLIPPTGDIGTMHTHGVEIGFHYDESAQTLTLCINQKPFYVRESQVWDVLDPTIRPYANTVKV
jgi:hypothetical protein